MSSNPVALKANPNVPAVPNPSPDPKALANVLSYVKQGLQSLAGQAGKMTARAVTFDDLISLGLATVTSGLAKGSAGTTTVVESGGSGVGAGGGSGTATFQAGPIVGINPLVRPALSALTQVNAAGAIIQDVAGGPIAVTQQAVGGPNWVLVGEPVSGPFTKTILVEPQIYNYAYESAGLFVADATGKFLTFSPFPAQGNLGVYEWTSPTQFSNDILVSTFNQFRAMWFKLAFDGTNLVFSFSSNGIVFDTFLTTPLTFIGEPVLCGMGLNAWGTSPPNCTAYLWAMN